MPINLRKEEIELLWLIQPNLQNHELEIKKKFDKPTMSMEVNDLMYLTISSDFDYIYKLNLTASSYRGNTRFFVFKVNASSQTVQDYLVLKLNENIDLSASDTFMCYLMDYTDLLDLESAAMRNETLGKIFQQFKRDETCAFNRNEEANKKDVQNSLNYHHQVYVDKEKAEMIKNSGEALGKGIVSLATMASNLIDTIGTQIATRCEQQMQQDEQMSTDGSESTGSSESCSDENENVKQSKHVLNETDTTKSEQSRHVSTESNLTKPKQSKKSDHRHSRRHKRRDYDEKDEENESSTHHRRHGRRHRRRNSDQNEDNNEEYRRSRRHRRHAANMRRLNQFTRQFSQTATTAASVLSSAITETASYIVPVVEDYLPNMISRVTNCDEETSRKMVGSMSNIKDSVSEGISIISASAANQSTQGVKNKNGNEAAGQSSDASGTART